MALIDATYFVRDINIPNTDNPTISEELVALINASEPPFLRELMGVELYNAFKAGIEAVTPDQKWLDIRDGKEYTYQGTTVRWEGLRNSTLKQSLIADHVFVDWINTRVQQWSGTAVTISTSQDNSTAVSPATLMSRAWNSMTKSVESFYLFMEASEATYPEWKRHYSAKLQTRINAFGL